MTAQPMHILLVEDNPGDARLIREMVAEARQNGLELAAHVERLAQALALLREKRYDLVLLDLSLPDSQGLDTCRQLRHRQPETPVVVLTGLDDRELAVQAVREGAQGYLVKGQVTGPGLAGVLRDAVVRHEHQRKTEDDLHRARQQIKALARIQERMLAQRAPAVGGYDLVVRYRPAEEASGDYYDFFPRPDGGTAVFLGDGTGHGPAASVLMIQMETILTTNPDLHGEPGPALTAASRKFGAAVADDKFMTGIYMVFDGDGRLRWASGGHDTPVHVNRLGEVTAVEAAPTGGPPLGIDPAAVYDTIQWHLEPGARLVLFTDGLVDVRNTQGQWLRPDGLRSLVAELSRLPLGRMVDEVIARAAAHQGGGPFKDDVTVIAVERHAQAGTR
jgi:serine phosphatase RsbU (regulator of sigma subunit)